MTLVAHQLLDGCIHLLTLQNKTVDNWFNMEFMQSLNKALDKIEEWIKDNPNAPCALVTVSSNSKIYSNGLFLEEAFKYGSQFFTEYSRLLKRLLVFPIPTVAGDYLVLIFSY